MQYCYSQNSYMHPYVTLQRMFWLYFPQWDHMWTRLMLGSLIEDWGEKIKPPTLLSHGFCKNTEFSFKFFFTKLKLCSLLCFAFYGPSKLFYSFWTKPVRYIGKPRISYGNHPIWPYIFVRTLKYLVEIQPWKPFGPLRSLWVKHKHRINYGQLYYQAQ